jgi:hypothetical protein
MTVCSHCARVIPNGSSRYEGKITGEPVCVPCAADLIRSELGLVYVFAGRPSVGVPALGADLRKGRVQR